MLLVYSSGTDWLLASPSFCLTIPYLPTQAEVPGEWQDDLLTWLACMQVAENFTSAKDGKVPNVE